MASLESKKRKSVVCILKDEKNTLVNTSERAKEAR